MRPLFKAPRARRKSDFYPTPPEAVHAVIASQALDLFPRDVWEPACGEGPISEALGARGYRVVSTDLEDYGYADGLADIDFLATRRALAPAIFTNPPFSIAAEFIAHSRALGVEYLALILKADFFHTSGRVALFEERPPAQILHFTWRLDFTGDGAPPMNCSCFVWRPDSTMARASMLRRPA